MTEFIPAISHDSHDIDSSSTACEEEPGAEFDKERLLDQLLRLSEKHGYDLEIEDLADMLGEDDEDFLGNLASFAAEYGIDHEDFFLDLGVPFILVIDQVDADELPAAQLAITDGEE